MAGAITYNSTDDSGGIAWVNNPVYFTFQSSDFGNYNTYKIRIKLFKAASNFAPQELVISRLRGVDENGKTNFEIQDQLKTVCKAEKPQFAAINMELCATHIFYTVQVYEVKDGVENLNTTLNFKAIPAGLERAAFDLVLQDHFINTARKFFTPAPDPKFTSHDVPEYLYYFLDVEGNATIQVNVRLIYHDNTTLNYSAHDLTTTRGMIRIPVGYEALNIKANATKPITGWSVYLTDSDNAVISETFNYRLKNHYFTKMAFLFKNSLGGFDTLVCAGDFAKSVSSAKSYAFRKEGGFEISRAAAIETRLKGEANTSWLAEGERDYLQDFIHSDEVYVISKNEFTPIEIENSEFVYHEKDNDLIGLSFSYQEGYKRKSFGRIINRINIDDPGSPGSNPIELLQDLDLDVVSEFEGIGNWRLIDTNDKVVLWPSGISVDFTNEAGSAFTEILRAEFNMAETIQADTFYKFQAYLSEYESGALMLFGNLSGVAITGPGIVTRTFNTGPGNTQPDPFFLSASKRDTPDHGGFKGRIESISLTRL